MNTAKKGRRLGTAAAVIAVGLAVSVVGGIGPVASAESIDPGFCIGSVYLDGGQTGKAGGKSCAVASEPPSEPIEESVTVLVERVDTGIPSGSRWKNAAVTLKLTRIIGSEHTVIKEETSTTNARGYINFNSVLSSNRKVGDVPFYSPSYKLELKIGGEVYERLVTPEEFTKNETDTRHDWIVRAELVGPNQWKVVV